jgi:hypothetical protein
MAENVLDLHSRALAEFGRRVHAVGEDQWGCPTPCKDWEVRNLVPIMSEQRGAAAGRQEGGRRVRRR